MAPVLNSLAKIFPPDRFLRDAASTAPFESDGLTAFSARPLAVVIPVTREEVVATLKLCDQHRIPFVARGSGTSLSGGSVPIEGGIVIALNRLNRILRIDPVQRIAGRERLALMLAIVDTLPPKCAQAFRLHKFDGLTHQQVALAMGISRSAVEKHISAALKQLLLRLP